MKKAVIILSAIALLGCTQAAKRQAADTEKPSLVAPVSKEEEQAINTLREFYELWITEHSKDIDIDENAIADIEKKYVSKELSVKLKKVFAEYELDYDPFLNAQDYDIRSLKTLEINPVAEQNDTYRICYNYDNEHTNCMTLFLVKTNGKYLINDILSIRKLEEDMEDDAVPAGDLQLSKINDFDVLDISEYYIIY
jgi:hypothetical protein